MTGPVRAAWSVLLELVDATPDADLEAVAAVVDWHAHRARESNNKPSARLLFAIAAALAAESDNRERILEAYALTLGRDAGITSALEELDRRPAP